MCDGGVVRGPLGGAVLLAVDPGLLAVGRLAVQIDGLAGHNREHETGAGGLAGGGAPQVPALAGDAVHGDQHNGLVHRAGAGHAQ